MGDPESDEHLRIFKCLVDTGSGVLRYTVERKMLINTSFEQYLNQNKHKFYHQFEKRRYKPCCSGNPHNCVVNGKMDKKIFFKMYNKKAELDTQDCLDRFEVNADISLDKLDLSDINFFLWNSATLSPQEEQSLKAIMTTRSAICHSSSSREFSLDELENFWLSLKNDLLLFAEPHHYKKSIEREITNLRNCSLSKIESKRVLDKMKKIFHEIKLETEAKNKSIENQMKKGNEGLKNCFRLENNSIKTHMNEKMHEILENCEKGSRTMKRCKKRIKAEVQNEGMKTRLQSRRNRNFLDTKLSDSERTICQKVKSNKRRMNKMLELTQEGMNQNSKRFKSMQTQQTETDMRIDKRVAQSQTQLSIKMEEEAHETRRQFKTGFKILLGVLGKQNITLGINQDQIEQLIESSDARDIYITSKLDQQCLTEDKEKNVIENLQSEIPIPPSNDINSDPSDKQAFQVIVKKVNSIILKLKATPGIFKSVETLKSALLTLVKNVHIAGKIDAEIEDTITVDLSFDSPLTKDQISVVKCLFSKEWNDENNDKTLSKEYTSSAKAKIESYPEHETSSQQENFLASCQEDEYITQIRTQDWLTEVKTNASSDSAIGKSITSGFAEDLIPISDMFYLDDSLDGLFEDLDINKRIWLAVGISLHAIIAPELRICAGIFFSKLYNSMVITDKIEEQTYPNYLKFYSKSKSRLNYEAVNNNKKDHGNEIHKYDYRVKNVTDASKLFLPIAITQYKDLHTCSLSSLIEIISYNVDIIPKDAKDTLREISRNIKDIWTRCDFTKWDEAKYSFSFNLMEEFVKKLQLTNDVESTVLEKLNKWINIVHIPQTLTAQPSETPHVVGSEINNKQPSTSYSGPEDFQMSIYCFRCKKKTTTVNTRIRSLSMPMKKLFEGTCTVCGGRKTLFR